MILVRRPFAIFDVDVLGAVALLVIGTVAWIGVIAPIREHHVQQGELARSAVIAEASITRTTEMVRATDADNIRLREAVEQRTRQTPTASASSRLFHQISAQAEDFGLQVTQLTPQPAKTRDGRVTCDVQVVASGDLLAFARFLDRLGRENPCHGLAEYVIARAADSTDGRCRLTWTSRLHLLPDANE